MSVGINFGQSRVFEQLTTDSLFVNEELVNAGSYLVAPGISTDNSIQFINDPTSGINFTTSPTAINFTIAGNTVYTIGASGPNIGYQMGGMYSIGNTAITPASTIGAYFKAIFNNTNLSTYSNGFSMPSVNRLQYNGTVSKPVLITAYVEYSTASVSSSNVWFAIYQNGNLINQSISPSICPVGSTVNTSINCISIANPTDYFELWLNDQTSAVAITVSSVSLSIK